jgi:dipeptidyl aminopeptidase/acylaminoacyl peptidase
MRVLLALGVSLCLTIPFQAQAPKQPITHEDVWLMKRVGAPKVSPDGKWAVFSVTVPSYDPKEQSSDLWLKSLESDRPARQITFTKGAEGSVAWAPDSRRLAFTAKREGDEAAQIYVLDLEGGEAERYTTLTLGAKQPRFSPDGTRLLFTSDTFPGAQEEAAIAKEAKARKDRKSTAKTYDAFPIRSWDHWLEDRKTSIFVMDAKAGAPAKNLLAGTKLFNDPNVSGSPEDDGQNLDALWAPDGASIVFVAVTNRHQAARAQVESHLFQVSASGGEPQRLTSGTWDHGQPQFAPDGKSLYCLTSPNDEKAYHAAKLTRYAWPFQDHPEVLTASLDRSISRYAVAPNRIYFTYEHAGLERLYSMPSAGGAIREEANAPTGCIGGLSLGGSALVGLWESSVHPPELYSFTSQGPKALTAFNEERASKLDWQPVEHFWTTSKKGKQLHSMLVKPAGFDPAKKIPLFVVIHGGAASMWRDAFVLRWNYHLLARPGYGVLLTDYTGSTGYGEAFAQAIAMDPLKGPAEELNEAADDALHRFPFLDAKRQVAGGASYGGHLANWLQATTTRYKAIVSHAGEMDLALQWGVSDGIYHREMVNGGPVWAGSKIWQQQSPLYQGGNQAKGTGFKTPILITAGEQDFRVPVANAIMNYSVQQRLQVPSRLVVFPDENHWILKGENSKVWYQEVHAWLEKWLK